jgi:hypothetical protein
MTILWLIVVHYCHVWMLTLVAFAQLKKCFIIQTGTRKPIRYELSTLLADLGMNVFGTLVSITVDRHAGACCISTQSQPPCVHVHAHDTQQMHLRSSKHASKNAMCLLLWLLMFSNFLIGRKWFNLGVWCDIKGFQGASGRAILILGRIPLRSIAGWNRDFHVSLSSLLFCYFVSITMLIEKTRLLEVGCVVH